MKLDLKTQKILIVILLIVFALAPKINIFSTIANIKGYNAIIQDKKFAEVSAKEAVESINSTLKNNKHFSDSLNAKAAFSAIKAIPNIEIKTIKTFKYDKGTLVVGAEAKEENIDSAEGLEVACKTDDVIGLLSNLDTQKLIYESVSVSPADNLATFRVRVRGLE